MPSGLAGVKTRLQKKSFQTKVKIRTDRAAIAGAIQNLPTHKDAAPLDDRFLKKGAKVLAASKTAQFYDRDTTPEMASAGMQGFQDFMLNPDDMMDILEELEEERTRIFGAL